MLNTTSRRRCLAGLLLLAVASIGFWAVTPVSAVSSTIVISQVYGGGGNASATLKNDFIELYNRGTVATNLNGWSVQYQSAAGTGTWQVTTLTNVTLLPGQYYLIQEAAGANTLATPLPTPDAIGVIAMSATDAKVALVSNTTALSGGCPLSAGIVDLVGYGVATCFEGAATAKLTNTTAALRNGGGDADTDSNVNDFTIGTPNPRNATASSSTAPTGVGSSNPIVASPGQSILLFVSVTPGTHPASQSLTVVADLSQAFGLAGVPFLDDGQNGDIAANDHVFSYTFTAPGVPGTYNVPFTVSDDAGRPTSGAFAFNVQSAGAQAPIVISQIYGGGGNSGAALKNDFVELFNSTALPVSLTGWSVQYTSAAGTSWQVTTLNGVIPAGHYFLVQEGAGTGGTTSLPLPDSTGGINMSGTTGKVALVSNNIALSGGCPAGGALVDFVGFGTSATCFEGAGPTSNLSNTTAARRKAEGCVDTNNNNADFFSGAALPRNSGVAGTCSTAGATPLAIHDIQGPGNTSPYVGQLVITQGIVTGLKTNGFYLQAADSEVDADLNTSEGVFVFTSSAPPAAAAVGNYVEVTGTVQEFIPSADPNSPPTTEIGFGPTVTLFATGYPLPVPVPLTTADTVPTGGISQLEKYEGMRVSVPTLNVIAPTEGTVNEANATSTSSGVFYGVIPGIPRPLREPGVEIPDPLPAGAPPTVIRYDANPERIRVDSDGQPGAIAVDVTTGAVVTGLVGPLDYSFRSYTILQDPGAPIGVSGNIAAIPVDTPAASEFTIASFNMERFFDTINDPGKDDVALTPTAFANRLKKASLAIRNVLRMPDVIGVEEMENLANLQAVAAQVSADAIATGQPDPQYQAILLEGNDIGGIDVGFLVKSGRMTFAGDFFQIGANTIFALDGSLLNDRPSLVLHAVAKMPGAADFPVTIVVNHLRSLSGVDDPSDGNRVRQKRRAQAEEIANWVQAEQTASPGERIVLIGDFNAYEFSDGYVDVIGTIKGAPAPVDEVVLASADLVNPDLVDLVLEKAPADQRYSFVFDGVGQELDHVLVTQNMLPLVSRFEYARNNADFPEIFRNDATRPERISDHDMVVAYFTVPLVTTLTYTGPASATIGADVAASALVSGPSSGSILFTLGTGSAAVSSSGAIGSGAASAALPTTGVTRGPQPLTASFAGDGSFAATTASATVVVSQQTHLIYTGAASHEAGTPATLSAALADVPAGNPVGGALLTFTVDSTTVSAVTDASGVATVSISAVVGNHSVSVAYAGDSARYLLASSTTGSLTIVDTTPPVVSVPAPIIVGAIAATGAPVTFVVSATDGVDGTDPVSCVPGSGSTFAIGVTTVHCTASDLHGNTTTGTFTVTVLNHAPVAVADAASTLENTSVTIPVLANDSDVDGGTLTVSAVSSPAHGTASVGGGGVVYHPASGFAGSDTFSYTVADGQGGTASAQVTVSVSRLGRFVAFSTDLTWLRAGSNVTTGDVGANERRHHDWDHDVDDGDNDDVTVRVGESATMHQAGSRVVGDTVKLLNRSTVYDVIDNFLLNKRGTVLGTVAASMDVPFLALPASPAIVPGTAPVTVAKNGSLTLPPGSYGAVHVQKGGTLILAGGVYQLLSLDVDQQGTVLFHAATELRVKGSIDAGAKVKLIVDSSVSGLRASQILIEVEGRDVDCHHEAADDDGDDAGPVSVHIGQQSVVQANIYAPNGTVWLKAKTAATGAFIGERVRIGINTTLTLDSAFK